MLYEYSFLEMFCKILISEIQDYVNSSNNLILTVKLHSNHLTCTLILVPYAHNTFKILSAAVHTHASSATWLNKLYIILPLARRRNNMGSNFLNGVQFATFSKLYCRRRFLWGWHDCIRKCHSLQDTCIWQTRDNAECLNNFWSSCIPSKKILYLLLLLSLLSLLFSCLLGNLC